MSLMRTRPDIQHRPMLVNVQNDRRVQRTRQVQTQRERAHNTLLYRANLAFEQQMSQFTSWMRGLLG